MAWGTAELEPEVKEWLLSLTDADFGHVAFYIDLLAERGPLLDEPYTKQLRGKLRELRFYMGRDRQRISYYLASGRFSSRCFASSGHGSRPRSSAPSARWSAVCAKGTRRRTEGMNKRRAWSELRAERLSQPEARQSYDTAMRAFYLGEEVRRLRMNQGLSQQELAERMGVSQSVVARLEAGGVEPRLSTLGRVAHALGVELKVHFLTDRTGEPVVS